MTGISALIKEVWESTPASFHIVKTQREEGLLLSRKWALIRHPICQHLNHGSPSLQNCKQLMSVVYKPSHLWDFCNSSLIRLRHVYSLQQEKRAAWHSGSAQGGGNAIYRDLVTWGMNGYKSSGKPEPKSPLLQIKAVRKAEGTL